MPKPVAPRPSPLSIRLSAIERADLAARAGTRPISSYAKGLIFPDGGTRRSAGRRVPADQAALAQLLGLLGASGIAASLGRLAEAAETGSLFIDELTTEHLRYACDDVRAMHLLLLGALGKRVPEMPSGPEPLAARFQRAALDDGGGR